ncbi:MAG: hypothetical protein ABSE97_01800 [Verrucomicrobiota bacterium]|jgi:hypothetical protein
MNISTPKVRKDGESVIVSAEFHTSEHKDVLWFKLDAKCQDYVVTERGDAFLIGLLLYAMARGEDIHLDCPISEKLYYNLSNYLIPALSLANPKLLPIKVIPRELEHSSINQRNAVGTGFSGGVDSFCTFYDHFVNPQCPVNYRLTHLAFFNVGSHGDFGGEAARALFHKRLDDLKQFPIDAGLEFIVVDSNISEILQMSFLATSTIRSIAPVLLLQKLFRVYLFSSAYRMSDFQMLDDDDGHYEVLTLSMLSTESLDLYSSGCQYTRVQKTAIIAGYEPTQRYLDVCVSGVGNCSSCSKCMRTLFTLEMLGAIDQYSNIFDLAVYQANKAAFIGRVLANRHKDLYREIYNEMSSRHIRIPFKSRLLCCRHLCGSALRRMAKNVPHGSQ